MVTELTANATKLVLRTDESKWCRVSLTHGGRDHELGADTHGIVVERLLRGLEDNLHGPERGMIDAQNVVGVLSLAEHHASVYAAHRDGTRTLYFQDAAGDLIGRVELSDDQRQLWIAVLKGQD